MKTTPKSAKPQPGRPRACNPKIADAILMAYLQTGRWLASIKSQGISHPAFYDFLREFPEFASQKQAVEAEYRQRQLDLANSAREKLVKSGHWPAIEATLAAYDPARWGKSTASVTVNTAAPATISPLLESRVQAALETHQKLYEEMHARFERKKLQGN